MTLYLIGLGLNDEKDISLKGLEIIRKADIIYLENYTSLLQCSIDDLEKLYWKKIRLADRKTAELDTERILNEAKEQEVAFLIIGDPFSATTHLDLFKQAKESKIPVKVINNASILTAVGITGLQLYKFGRTTSIPFLDDQPELETPYQVIAENKKKGNHTLCLLDIKAAEKRFMTVNEALDTLETIEKRLDQKLIVPELKVIGCARLGSDNFIVRYGTISELKKSDFGLPPHCLVIPSKLHFIEEEALELWK
jgi:diphthine synthase